MIINYSINDRTQLEIQKHSYGTETLLEMATGTKTDIWLMPDSCPAHNAGRMIDGIFTGTVIKMHNLKTLVIPVGSTINYCGVCIYKLKHEIGVAEFKTRIENAKATSPAPYTWNNFDRGNHFVSLMCSDGSGGLEEGYYLVVHASANEYRPKLYPYPGVWYEKEIKTVFLPDNPTRSLRYIEGSTAEKFYQYVEELKSFNKLRNRNFCEHVLKGGLADKEILCVDHYGMPDSQTICIGVQWELDGLVPLLTAPGKDIYIVKPEEGTKYFPHGFGVKLPDASSIEYLRTTDERNAISIGGKIFHHGDSIRLGKDAVNRVVGSSVAECIENIRKVLPFTCYATLSQIASFSAVGFQICKKNNI